MNPTAEALLLRAAVLFLIVGSLAGVVVGAMLVRYPHRLRSLGDILNRWVSTRHLDRTLDRSIDLDPWFYRHHRVCAGLILLASIYISYAFTFGMDRANAIAGLSRYFYLPPVLVGGLLDALVLSALLGALLATFVSLFLLLRPSMLRDFEHSANRWVSLRRGLKSVEIRRGGLDKYTFKYSRQAGVLLMLGSLYTLVLLTFWLSQYR